MTDFDYSTLPPAAQATLRAGLLMQQILKDPASARQLQGIADKAAKAVNPTHQTAEEVAAPFVERVLQAVDQKFAALENKTAAAATTARLEQQINDAMTKEGFTEEGIKNILETMKTKGIADFDTAKKAYRFDNPAPDPSASRTVSDSMYWNVDKNMQVGDAKSFFFPDGVPTITENPDAWEKETALKFLNNEIGLPTS